MSRTIRDRESFDSYRQKLKGFQRDRKPWWKPPKDFKQLKRKKERAQAKDALRNGEEPIDKIPHTDVWEWM